MKDEEKLTKIRALDLWDKNLIDNIEVGPFKGLQEIHRYLFQDIFDFAGEIRKVNISKGNFRFAPTLFLAENLKIIDKMKSESFDEIVDKYVELYVAHPFREGNGRSMRIWLDALLKHRLGRCVDWSKIDKFSYLSAMERSPINSLELKVLLESALTDDIQNREIYMRGIQASYEYEGMSSYDIEDM